MSFRRYELILPTKYNDGSRIEQENFLQTNQELVAEFGAASFLPETIRGTWIYERHVFHDENVRLFVDVEDTPESVAFSKLTKKSSRNVSGRLTSGLSLTKSESPR